MARMRWTFPRHPLLWAGALVVSAVLVVTWRAVYRAQTPSSEAARLTRAIARTVRFLERRQLPSGGFPGVMCETPELTQCVDEPTPFYTMFVLHALSFLPLDQTQPLRQRAIEFLLKTQHHPGIWGFASKQSVRRSWYPPDLDDTACAHAALRLAGSEPPEESLEKLARDLHAPEGAFFTWFGFPAEDNEIDCAVVANALFALALEGRWASETAAYLNRVVLDGQVPACSVYYPRPEIIHYFVSRAYRDGRVQALGPAVRAASKQLRMQQRPDGSVDGSSITACAALVWLNAGESDDAVQRAVNWLLNHQRRDGGWNPSMLAGRTYAGPWFSSYFGSESMTTALVLEALIKARQTNR